ncbi:MAG: AAA family ATPase [Candidatus Falkowbacteria bacterium]
MATKIIGLVGSLAAGKGTIAKYLIEQKAANGHRFSTMLRDILKRIYVEEERGNLQILSTILRQNFGEDIMAKVIANDVTNDEHDIVVIDGVRRFADITYLTKLPNFILARVVADPEIRFERLVKRAENPGDTEKTFNQFLADELKEADAEVPMVMEKADVEINNNGNLDELYQQIDRLIEK